jgi:hypothetical protein
MISFGTEMRRLYNYSSIAEKAVTLILIFFLLSNGHCNNQQQQKNQQKTKGERKPNEGQLNSFSPK